METWHAILMLLSIVNMPFYGFVLHVIWKFRKTETKGSFWRLVLVLGGADLLASSYTLFRNGINIFFTYDSLMTNLPLSTFIANVVMVVSQHCEIFQILCLTAITWNRFGAIVYPSRYESLWNSRRVKRTTMTLVLVPLGISALQATCSLLGLVDFHLRVHPPETPKSGRWIGFSTNQRHPNNTFYLHGCVNSWYCFVQYVWYSYWMNTMAIGVLIAYVVMLVKYRIQVEKTKKVVQKSGNDRDLKDFRIQRNLALAGFVVSLGMLSQAWFFYDVAQPDPLVPLNWMMFVLQSIYFYNNNNNPYMLLLFSKQLKTAFKKSVGK